MQVNIEKRHLFLILALIVFLTGIILVVGYGGNNPRVVGHSFEEIEGVQKKISGMCNSSSAIREIYEDGSVSCGNIEKGKLECWYEYGSNILSCDNICKNKNAVCVDALETQPGEQISIVRCISASSSFQCRCCKIV